MIELLAWAEPHPDLLALTEESAAAQSRQQAVVNGILGEFHESLAALEAARKQELLLQTRLLPQVELGFQSALAGYQTGKVDFATLLDAQRQIRQAGLDELKSRVERQMRLTKIECLAGESGGACRRPYRNR